MTIQIMKTPVSNYKIDERNAGQRIDNFLMTYLKSLPKSHLYRIIRKGEVRVNKKRIKPDYKLQSQDIVRIPPLKYEAEAPLKVQAPPRYLIEKIQNSILYEDKNILVFNKPSGLAVHGGSNLSFGLIETLRHIYPQERCLELVHRLDRDTSGCILVARKLSALKELHHLLRLGAVEKTYLALVKGYWPKHIHIVDVPLRKNHLQSGERIVNVHQEGKEALTEFKVLKRYSEATLVEAKPKTGRTHQIRVHAQYAGHAIVGDDKYMDRVFNKKMQDLGCKRLFLHAYRLEFALESTGEKFSFQAELPQELTNFLGELEKI